MNAYPWCLRLVAWMFPRDSTFLQTAKDVTTREPGARVLGKLKPVGPEASKHWEYAWISEAAYRKMLAAHPKRRPRDRETDIQIVDRASQVLQGHGWELWKDFPDDGLLRKISVSHLRVEVWEHLATNSIVVAFGGTVFKSGKDWKSNLRWFLPKSKDEYTEIVAVFGPAFKIALSQRAQSWDPARSANTRLYATGHSLGGGLAQQFAYALPVQGAQVRVQHVYAFDPSPVTGYFSVAKKLRESNRIGLSIDRIYERGEVLALVRSLTSLFVKPSAVNPTIRGIRYDLFPSCNPIHSHSMDALADGLQASAFPPSPPPTAADTRP